LDGCNSRAQTYLPQNQLVFSVVYRVTQCCLVHRMGDKTSNPPVILHFICSSLSHSRSATIIPHPLLVNVGRRRLKCEGTRANTRFRLSAKRTCQFKLVGASVQSTTGSQGVRISGGNAGYTMFRRSVKGTGYPLHSPVSPSLPHPCVTVCLHISTGLYSPY